MVHSILLIEGRLDVCLEDEVLVSVAQLGPGQFVGEMSCLTGEPVSATVKAIGTVYTLSMPREGMIQLMCIVTNLSASHAGSNGETHPAIESSRHG